MNRLVAVVLVSAGCAAARAAPESAQTVAHPIAADMVRITVPDPAAIAAQARAKEEFIAELRRAALARAREEAIAGLGSDPTCPMPVFRGDTAVAPMTVFPTDSSRRHTMFVLPPGCRPRGD